MSHDAAIIQELHMEIRRLRKRIVELEQRNNATHHMLTVAPTILYVYDMIEQHNTYTNREVGEVLGYSADEFQSDGPILTSPLLHPEDQPQVQKHFARLTGAQEGEVIEIEYRLRHRDGTWHWFLERDIPFIRDLDGTLRQIVGTIQDITESKNLEKALKNSEERFRAIIERSPAGICITNARQQFEYVNPTYCQIYHYTPEELLGQPFTLVVPEHQRPLLSALHDQFLQEGTEIRGEWQVVTKEGETLTILADAARIIGEDGQPRKVTFVLDITELKQSEAARARLQEEVILAQEASLRELSTPLIPITDTVVMMPLIGSVDSLRAQLVLETLVEGVVHYQAEVVILDITGVKVVDTQVATTLLRAAQAIKLLGARVILTGVQPAIAQTLVTLGVDMHGMLTQTTLQKGIAYALGYSMDNR